MTPTSPAHPGSSGRDSARAEAASLQFVGFRLDGADYAIAITGIREIILMKPITRLPGVADVVEGLINLRGTVIPVLNLRRRFGLEGRAPDEETRIIVVTVQDKTMGCIVDEVTQVIRIATDQIQPMPVALSVVARPFLAGLAKVEDRLLILLDLETLFGSDLSLSSSSSRLPESGA